MELEISVIDSDKQELMEKWGSVLTQPPKGLEDLEKCVIVESEEKTRTEN